MMASSNGNIFRINYPLWVESTGHKDQWREALVLSLIRPWTNSWANNRNDCHLWRRRAHCDVTVMHLPVNNACVILPSPRKPYQWFLKTLQLRHNGYDGVSSHQPPDCLLNRLFRRGSKKHQGFASLAFVQGIQRWPVNSPHKWPVTRTMFPFDDIIMKHGFRQRFFKIIRHFNC